MVALIGGSFIAFLIVEGAIQLWKLFFEDLDAKAEIHKSIGTFD